MKGKLIQVSPYGFRVEGDPNWHNFIKNRNQVFSENAKKYINKKIEWDEDNNGQVNRLSLAEEKKYEADSKKIKIFQSTDIKELEKEVNEFGKKELIVASQITSRGNLLVMVCYYE